MALDGTTCAWAGKSGWWALKAVYFLVASFVFSWIFWKTKELVEKKPAKKKK